MSLLGIDIGTSICKAAAFSAGGRCLALAQREHSPLHSQPGYAELSIQDVWMNVQEIAAEVAHATSQDPVTALSVSSMGEAMVPMTRNREILGNSVLCTDPRGAAYSEALEAEIGAEAFYRINANIIGPNFSLSKLMWIRDEMPNLFARTDHFLPVSECIAFLLGAEPCFSQSQACRTLLFDVYSGKWSRSMFEWSGLDESKFAPTVAGGAVIGSLSSGLAKELGLPEGIPIVAAGHDQCPTALGCGCIHPGMASCGIGTFECISPIFGMPDDPMSMHKVGLNIENHVLSDLYISFIYNHAGSLVKWFRDTFASDQKDDSDIYRRLNEELPGDPTNLLVLPHFDPPLWPSYISDSAGAIIGLRSSTARGEILKAIMECASLYLLPGVQALEQIGEPLTALVAVGGGASSDAWVQINADIFGVSVSRPRNSEAGLVGAAMLAGLAGSEFANPAEAAEAMVQMDKTFEPDEGRHKFYLEKSQKLERVHPLLKEALR